MSVFTSEQSKIIDFIKTNGTVTLPQLSRALGQHRSSLYYQLKLLVSRGVLKEVKLSTRRTEYSLESSAAMQRFIDQEKQVLSDLLLSLPRNDLRTKKPRLVIPDAYIITQPYITELKKHYEVVRYEDSPVRITPEAFVLRCQDADVVVTFFSVAVTREMLVQCPHLKVLITASVSMELIDEAACEELGITLFSLTPYDYFKKAARAEFVFASLFNLLRPLSGPAQALRMGRFEHRGVNAHELRGKTVGVVGVKREGREIIPLLRAFGCAIQAHDPDGVSVRPSDVGMAAYSSLQEMFASCDIMIFPEDYNVTLDLSARYINTRMRTKYLLLLSYSLKLDLDVLRERIIDRSIQGLVIDYFPDSVSVYDTFPTSDYRKIMNFPNVMVTPEIGFYTAEAMERNNQEVVEILQNFDWEKLS